MKHFSVFCLFILIATSHQIIRANSLSSDTSITKATVPKKTALHRIPVAGNCAKIEAVVQIISEAIAVGAPTYNDGNHIGCYRIYEGASYKILHKYGAKCKDVKNILEIALEKSYGDYNATEKAWIMRMAFDQILGVPTTTK